MIRSKREGTREDQSEERVKLCALRLSKVATFFANCDTDSQKGKKF